MLIISPKYAQYGLFNSFIPKGIPLGGGLISGYLRERGMSVRLIDEQVTEIKPSTLAGYLEKCEKPRIVGISCMTINVARGYQIAQQVKSIDSETIIVFGGIHPTVLPDEVLTHSCDYVVVGEGEYTFLELCSQIKARCIQPEKLAGVVFNKNGTPFYANGPAELVDLNQIPVFPYDLIDWRRYDLGYIVSSRGCPHRCIFCSSRSISKSETRYMSNEKIIQELDILVNGFKVPNVSFMDDFFAQNRQRVFGLCEAMRKAGFNKKCSFQAATRGDSVTRELLAEMKSAGFTSLEFGVESSSDKVMESIRKEETVQDNIRGMRLAKEMGFTVEATFIYGLPSETRDDRVGALKLARMSGVDRALFSNLTPYPGTEMYRIAHQYGKLRVIGNWDNFNYTTALTQGFKTNLPYVPSTTTENELVGTTLLANLLFYLNFRRFIKLLNPLRKPSDKWFVFPLKKMANPALLIRFLELATVILTRTTYYLLTEKNCRRFIIKSAVYARQSKISG